MNNTEHASRATLSSRASAIALVLICGALSACSSLNSSAPISDTQVDTSHRAYERQQGQIKALNDSGAHRVASYSTGDADYNLLLSQRRANTLLECLRAHNIDVDSAPVAHRGDTQQVGTCERQYYSRDGFIDCLLPNRRVEVVLKLLPL